MKLKILCIILAITTVAACGWAVSAELRCLEYNGRLAELMASVDSAPAGEYSPEEAAAEFEGGIVTVAEAAAEYAIVKPYYEMLGYSEAEYAEDAKIEVLDNLIEEKILENKAREAGIYELNAAAEAELEARVKAEYEDNVEYYMAFRFDESKSDAQVREETIAYLKESGYSYEELLEQSKKDYWKERLYEYVTADFTVSDEQLRKFYEEQLESARMIYSANYAEYESDCEAGRAVLWHPEGVRRIQMLVAPFDGEQAAEYADIQALLEAGEAGKLEDLDALYRELEPQAAELLNELSGGADFGALFEDWGYGNPEGECIAAQSEIFGEEIRDAAMALEGIGDISGAVRCDAGLCILRYAADVESGAVAFEEVAGELRASYAEELRMSQYNATVVGWINEANVKYYTERF